MSVIRVVIADDHQIFRESLAVLLGMHRTIEVVAEAAHGGEAVVQIREHQPDVVLLDVEMPGQSVFTTLAEMRAASPDTRVIILTMYERASLARRLFAGGAAAYLVKSIGHHELVAAIVASVAAPADVVTYTTRRGEAADLGETSGESLLSARERQVLTLAARALSNAQIANDLTISEGTVKRHLANVNTKLQATSRMDAVRRAFRLGVIGESLDV